MQSIETMLPEAGRADAAGLRDLDADTVARWITDPAHLWWQRIACVDALAGRVPEQCVPELLACVRDPEVEPDVRLALLGLLAERSELLPWLLEEDRPAEEDDRLPGAVLKARGRAGDLTAAGQLAMLAFNAHRDHEQTDGEAGLDALVARYGAGPVRAEVGDERPEDRAFQLRMGQRAAENLTEALADPDRRVAHLAHSLIASAEHLRAYLDDAPTTEAKLWAACALYRLTGDVAEIRAIDSALGCPRVGVSGLDDELRGAILHEYADHCGPRGDPRWRIERICAEPPVSPDEDAQLARASAALIAGGLTPKPPVFCSEDFHQGDGTYHVICCGESRLLVSTLGRFVTAENDDDIGRQALESAGFRWIDATTGAIEVTGLHVYYFGRVDHLTVENLLFYWQD